MARLVMTITIFVVWAQKQKQKYRQMHNCGDHTMFSSIPVLPRRNKWTSDLDLYCNVDENWNDYQGSTASSSGATWESNGAGGAGW